MKKLLFTLLIHRGQKCLQLYSYLQFHIFNRSLLKKRNKSHSPNIFRETMNIQTGNDENWKTKFVPNMRVSLWPLCSKLIEKVDLFTESCKSFQVSIFLPYTYCMWTIQLQTSIQPNWTLNRDIRASFKVMFLTDNYLARNITSNIDRVICDRLSLTPWYICFKRKF